MSYLENISVEEAKEIVINSTKLLQVESVPLKKASGLICASPILADMDIPNFDNSAMDGFAVRAKDIKAPGESLKIVGEVKAGGWFEKKVEKGQAVKIMTGAPLPDGADTVVRKEDTSEGWKDVTINVLANQGDNVRPRGEDVKKGEVVLDKGEMLTAGAIGVAASCGLQKIPVYPRPKVSILATGDELVRPSIKPKPGQVRTSNTYTMVAQTLALGAIPRDMGIARDTFASTRTKLINAIDYGDVVLTSGGVSVGEYDFVKEVLDDLGMKLKFWRVRQRPGHPLAFGMVEDKLIFALPGNPVASMVTFEQYVRPALLTMMGHKKVWLKRTKAILTEDIKVKAGRVYFLRTVLSKNSNGGLEACLTGPQGSGILKSMARANGLIILPEEVRIMKKGETVDVDILPGACLSAD